MSTPEWVTKLAAEPCECVRCDACRGTGTIYVDFRGRYIGANITDDMDQPETCDMCRGGIIEWCDRCTSLNDYDMDE